jgi:cell wall-associated NlpC family hydrolase
LLIVSLPFNKGKQQLIAFLKNNILHLQRQIQHILFYLFVLITISSCNLLKYGIEERKKGNSTHKNNEVTKDKNRQEKASTIINAARAYQGTPYQLGGETKSGIDCSALVMISFKAANITLPRTSIEQSKIGKLMSKEQALPGDLIFFKFKKSKSSNPVNHVGIVSKIEKNGIIYFYHASTSLGVTESSLEEHYYKEVFVKIMRVY